MTKLYLPPLTSKYSLPAELTTSNFLIKRTHNCDFNFIKTIPNGSSIIVGHPYGSPISHNILISKKLELFLRLNKNRINKIFLTGDIFYLPTPKNWENLYSLIGENTELIIAPGNHDVDSLEKRVLFNESIKHSTNYPITTKLSKFEIIVEDSVKNNWLIS